MNDSGNSEAELPASMPDYKESDISSQVWQTRILHDQEHMNNPDEAKLRKRAAKRSVPDAEKDSAYWERRHRNNAAAKRSREIKRQQEFTYKSFVNNAVASFEQLSKWCRTLLEYCPHELQKQAEAEISVAITRFQQNLPQNIHSDRSLDFSCPLSPHDDHNRTCDGDLDTDGGSHSSMISEAGEESNDLQITHVEKCVNKGNYPPPVLSPAPIAPQHHPNNQSAVFPLRVGDSMKIPISSPTPVNLQTSAVNATSQMPHSSQDAQLEAMQFVLQKQQEMGVGTMGGIPVIINADNALLNAGYQQLLLKNLVSSTFNQSEPKSSNVYLPKLSNLMLPETNYHPESLPHNPVLKTSPEHVEPKLENVLAVDPTTGNVITLDPKNSAAHESEKQSIHVGSSEWLQQQRQQATHRVQTAKKLQLSPKSFHNPTSTNSQTSIHNHDSTTNVHKWSVSRPNNNMEDVPEDIRSLVPLVSRVFVSLDTKDIVELIRCIAQEFLMNMGETVPSAGSIWQIFIAIRDAIPTLGKFRPQDINTVIRKKFKEIQQTASTDTDVIEDSHSPYQQLLTHFQTYLSEQLKEQQASRQDNRPSSPKRPRLPEKKPQNAYQEIVGTVEGADGGVIDNALHRCSVELEKRSQMTFKRLEMLRSRPGITIEQLNDELKKITNNSDSFQKMLDKAMTNEMQLRTLHAKARNYHSNGSKKS